MTKFRISNDGLSLLEVIIALAIASIVALGLVKATGSAVKSSRFSADQSQITALAQEKIAKIVSYENRNAVKFWSDYSTTNFSDIGFWGAVDVAKEDTLSQSDTCFVTAVNNNTDWSGPTPTDPNPKMAKITVDVYWGAKDNSPNCGLNTISYSHTLHFETNVTN